MYINVRVKNNTHMIETLSDVKNEDIEYCLKYFRKRYPSPDVVFASKRPTNEWRILHDR